MSEELRKQWADFWHKAANIADEYKKNAIKDGHFRDAACYNRLKLDFVQKAKEARNNHIEPEQLELPLSYEPA